MVRNAAKTYFLILLVTLILILSASLVSAHSLGGVRNLRINRLDAGGSNDRLVASWNHAAGLTSGEYIVYISKRYPGDGWSSWSFVTGASGTSFWLSRVYRSSDFDMGVRIVTTAHHTVHASTTARLCGIRGDIPTSGSRSCGGGGGGGSGSESGGGEANRIRSRPPVYSCETLSLSDRGITVYSSQGLKAGIQCQQIGAAGIGNQAIIDAGFIDAVDVWGSVNDAHVCFPQDGGSFRFLDAATSPRAVEPLESYHAVGLFCAGINRAGTVVLMAAAESPADSLESGQPAINGVSGCRNPTAFAPVGTAKELGNCIVTTDCQLNLRNAPIDGDVLGVIPPNVSVPADARTSEWFRVERDGQEGWLYAWMVRYVGQCR